MIDSSIPAMALRVLQRNPQGSLFARHQGVWEEYTPERFLKEWQGIWSGLKLRGVSSQQGIGIMAASSPQWMIADLAIQSVGAWTVPLFPNLSVDVLEYECKDSHTNVIFTQSLSILAPEIQEYLKKQDLLIALDDKTENFSNCITWQSLLAESQTDNSNSGKTEFVNAIQSYGREDLASIVYTSGSTGMPKGAEISHQNLLFQFDGASERYPQHPLQDRAITTLPVAHIFERMVVYYFMYSGIPIYFSDDPKATLQYIQEIKPTIMTLVPRFLEKVQQAMALRWKSEKGMRKLVLWLATRYALKHPAYMKHGWLFPLYEKLVYKRFQMAMGGSFKAIISGSSALPFTVHNFLLNVGIPVIEGYGLTECAPTVSGDFYGSKRVGTVGPAFPGVKIRIGSEEEVQVQSLGIMRGYHNNAPATAACWTDDGWFRTGDKGFIGKDGHLKLTGRLKEIFKLSTGKFVSPVPIEQAISKNPIIEHAVVTAENRKYVAAIIFLNHEGVKSYLRKDTFDAQKAVASQHIRQRIEKHIENINKRLNEWEKVKKWVILADQLTVEDGLLTPTFKVKRKEVELRYNDKLVTLYDS